jgi:hypothetical protein
MPEVHLGALGSIHEARVITFDWFNSVGDHAAQKIRVSDRAGELDYVEFLALAAEVDENDEVEGMKVIMGYMRQQIDERDWDLFWTGAKAGRQQLKDLMNVSKSILEAVTDFPTGQASASSPGQKNTRRKSKAISSKRGTTSAPLPKSKEDRATERALVLLQGRPDLQTAVIQSEDSRKRRALQAAG